MTREQLIAHFLRTAERFPTLRLDTMISTTAKMGPSDVAGVWNLPVNRTCCTDRADGSMIATWACRGCCYAAQMAHGRDEVKRRARRNWFIAQRPDFPELLAGAILHRGYLDLKLHGFGEFFSPAYVQRCCQVARWCPQVQFLVFTRAWRIKELRGPLCELAALPNVHLLTSHDRHSPEPAEIPGTRECWLMDSDGDPPPRPMHLAFRASCEAKHVVLKKANGTVVCPYETGLQPDTNCHSCRYCFFKERQRSSTDGGDRHRPSRRPLFVVTAVSRHSLGGVTATGRGGIAPTAGPTSPASASRDVTSAGGGA